MILSKFLIKLLKDGEYYIWEDGWPMTYTNWGNIGEKDKTTCLSINVTSGLWYHDDCYDSMKPYICKFTTGKGALE